MGELIRKSSTEITLLEKRVEIPASVKIPHSKKEIYLSNKNFPKINTVKNKNIVVSEIHAYINLTMIDFGVTIDSDEIKILLTRVTDDIMLNFSTYTLEEIRLAFYYGVRGEFGKFYGLNPATFYSWLKKFRYELLPPITKQIIHALPDPKKVELTQQETDRSIANVLIDVYFKLWNSGEYTFFDGGNNAYYLLESLNLLILSPADKFVLMDKGRQELKREIKKEDEKLRKRGKKFHRIDIPKAMKEIEKALNPQYEHRIKFRAMQIAVYDYLYGLATEDVDFKELIDGKLAEKIYN